MRIFSSESVVIKCNILYKAKIEKITWLTVLIFYINIQISRFLDEIK